MKNIFFSYSSNDNSRVAYFKSALESVSDYRIWIDLDSISPSKYYAEEIVKAIKTCHRFLIFLSKHSVGDNTKDNRGSENVSRELALAAKYEIPIVPIVLDDIVLKNISRPEYEYFLTKLQYIDAANIFNEEKFHQEEFSRVVIKTTESIENGVATFDNISILDEVEKHLRKNEFAMASRKIQSNTFPSSSFERLVIFKSLVTLKEQPIRNFSQLIIDKMVKDLKAIKEEPFQHIALYLCGVLSRFYYQKNAIADPTGGISELKMRAEKLGKLERKYVLMTEPILPPKNGFALIWMRPQ